jgi:predicted transport protein
MQLSGEDVLKVDEVVTQPLEKCLLYLAYKADKSFLEGQIHREMLAKMKK